MSTSEKHDPATQAALAVHVANLAQQNDNQGLPALSIRHVDEPCATHAKDPPGEQKWNTDGTKKRDPNGYVHNCPNCKPEIRVED